MISAKILQDSIYYDAGEPHRITSFELEYPRYIHSELMTHRVFSRNAASSRAIPIGKVIQLVEEAPVQPHWTANQAGMQGKTIECPHLLGDLEKAWLSARDHAVAHAKVLSELGAHKQNVNRILEPFQHIKVVITATDFKNFFALRCHKDAQPEIQLLANRMRQAMKESEPMELFTGEWHVPYVDRERCPNTRVLRYSAQGQTVSPLQARQISASCSAQVSYRVLNQSLEKALDIYNKLVDSKPIHASPFEHQATPNYGAGEQRNFTGWVQHRSLINGDTIYG